MVILLHKEVKTPASDEAEESSQTVLVDKLSIEENEPISNQTFTQLISEVFSGSDSN